MSGRSVGRCFLGSVAGALKRETGVSPHPLASSPFSGGGGGRPYEVEKKTKEGPLPKEKRGESLLLLQREGEGGGDSAAFPCRGEKTKGLWEVIHCRPGRNCVLVLVEAGGSGRHISLSVSFLLRPTGRPFPFCLSYFLFLFSFPLSLSLPPRAKAKVNYWRCQGGMK